MGAVMEYVIVGPARSSRTCFVKVATLPALLVAWIAIVYRPSAPTVSDAVVV